MVFAKVQPVRLVAPSRSL